MPIDPVSTGLGIAAQIPKGIVGAIEWGQANKALKSLNKNPIDQYSISPELQNSYSRAEGMANQGFSTEETALFNKGVGRQQAGAFRQATDMSGGNLSTAIGAALQADNIGGQADFAAKGAQLKAQHIQYADSLARGIQNQKNLMTQAKIQRRTMLEQAYGGAKRAGIENVANAFSGIATMGLASKSPVVPTNNVPAIEGFSAQQEENPDQNQSQVYEDNTPDFNTTQ